MLVNVSGMPESSMPSCHTSSQNSCLCLFPSCLLSKQAYCSHTSWNGPCLVQQNWSHRQSLSGGLVFVWVNYQTWGGAQGSRQKRGSHGDSTCGWCLWKEEPCFKTSAGGMRCNFWVDNIRIELSCWTPAVVENWWRTACIWCQEIRKDFAAEENHHVVNVSVLRNKTSCHITLSGEVFSPRQGTPARDQRHHPIQVWLEGHTGIWIRGYLQEHRGPPQTAAPLQSLTLDDYAPQKTAQMEHLFHKPSMSCRHQCLQWLVRRTGNNEWLESTGKLSDERLLTDLIFQGSPECG